MVPGSIVVLPGSIDAPKRPKSAFFPASRLGKAGSPKEPAGA